MKTRFLLLAALLAGCATPPPPKPMPAETALTVKYDGDVQPLAAPVRLGYAPLTKPAEIEGNLTFHLRAAGREADVAANVDGHVDVVTSQGGLEWRYRDVRITATGSRGQQSLSYRFLTDKRGSFVQLLSSSSNDPAANARYGRDVPVFRADQYRAGEALFDTADLSVYTGNPQLEGFGAVTSRLMGRTTTDGRPALVAEMVITAPQGGNPQAVVGSGYQLVDAATGHILRSRMRASFDITQSGQPGHLDFIIESHLAL